jgi:gluconokinase
VLVPKVFEGSGFGAAVLAMYAVGKISRLEDVNQLIQIDDRYQPNLSHTHRYQRMFEIYDRLYRDNVQDFTFLNDLCPPEGCGL